MTHWVCFLLLGFCFFQCRNKVEYVSSPFPGKPGVPASIKKQHEHLLNRIRYITKFEDSTGRAAGKLYQLMEHHFKEEEDYVLPPLGVLPLLAVGKTPEKKEQLIQLTEKYKSNSAHMIAEHQLIGAYIDEMTQAAAKEDHKEIGNFKEEVHDHASMEEEVFFPAVIVIGKYLELKSPS